MCSKGHLDRTDIVNQVRKVYLQPSQTLRQFSLPDSVYDLARNFATRGTTVENYGKKHCRYYTVLDCIEGGDIYALLEQAARLSTLEQVHGVIAQWQNAIKALLQYALNLLLAPNRPELRTVKLYNSFFVYQVTNKLKGAEKILLALGYSHRHQPSSSSTRTLYDSQALVYNGEVDIDHVAETATDLVVLLCDLEQLEAYVMDMVSLAPHQPPVQVILAGVLKAWSLDSCSAPTNDAVSVASSSQGNGEIGYDLNISSQLPQNDSGANFFARNLDSLNVQTWREDLERDHIPCRSRDYEHGAINMHPLLEACQYSPKHGSGQETPRNIWTRGLGPVDDCLQHPADTEAITAGSTLADSLSSSFLQGIPRPNIEDLPEPIYNEEEFSLEKDRFFVNPRSLQDACDNSLIGRDFSLDKHAPANCCERTNSSVEQVHTAIKRYPCGAAEEVSSGTINDPSLSLHRASLKRSQSYDLADHSPSFNSSLLEAGAVHRSDSDLAGSYRRSSTGTDCLITSSDHQVYQSNLNQVSILVKKKQTGDKVCNQNTKHLQSKDEHIKNSAESILFYETGLTEDGFVVIDLRSNISSTCSETRTSGATYCGDQAPNKVEWMSSNTTQASMWTCHYCTNINSKYNCEICGGNFSSN